jgi:nitroimidazol reductase NimA-like FMN-containing flavoprotein (pyridoxamine 5'-phosphate oxidase superfamily)
MGKYHMTKQEREITDENELLEILAHGKFAVVAMCRENEPYIVSLSYGYDPGANNCYFHTANEGLKLDFIRKNPYVCATVIDDRGYQKNECAHAYRSVVLFGRMTVVSGLEEKKHGMEVLFSQLEEDPQPIRDRALKSDEAYGRFTVLKLEISEISGKKGQ